MKTPYTDEERNSLDKQLMDFFEYAGMLKALRIVEDSLGKTHAVTIELRKACNEQNKNSHTISDELLKKVLSNIE